MKIPRLKSATKLALFSSAIMLVFMGILYAALYYSFNEQLRYVQAGANAQSAVTDGMRLSSGPTIFVLLVMIVIFSFLVSSLIIDKALNPVRYMIDKVKALGEKNFNSKIFIETSEDELREYAYAFNHMTSTINEYIEKQKRFISDASHELVTPITVIAGHANMLQRWGKDDPATLETGLEIIKKEALSMNQLIESLLFLARSDNEKIDYSLKKLMLNTLIEESVREQKLLHTEFDFTLGHEASITILGDYEALKQVFRIVFDNGVKYSTDKKEIGVDVNRENEKARIRISDKGCGIPAQYLRKVFDRFYRADDSRNKETGGTGLGLAIAKEIVEAHGGSIAALNNEFGGTTIEITLCAIS